MIDLGGEGASTEEIAILDDVILKPRMRTVNFLQSEVDGNVVKRKHYGNDLYSEPVKRARITGDENTSE